MPRISILPALLVAAILTPFAISQRAALPPAAAVETVPRWQLRSEHFIWGMPRATDDRHQIVGRLGTVTPGISVLVREGSVIEHYDKFKVPA